MAYNLSGFAVVNGTTAAETLTGKAGSDAIYGKGGADVLDGGKGADVLFGGAGNVTFKYSVDGTWGAADSTVMNGDPSAAGTGATVSLSGYGRSFDVFVGTGSGNTLLMPDGHNALLLDDTMSPGADGVRLVNIQSIVGGAGGQVINLTSATRAYGPVNVQGGSGNDTIWTNAGKDVVRGGAGHDAIATGSGNDWVNGEAGNDTISGGAGNDTLAGDQGLDVLDGGAGNDGMFGGGDNDTLIGGAGDDVMYGDGANDKLSGGGDNDTLYGGTGNDILDGGTGADTMTGGMGNDTFVVDNAGDIVTDGSAQGMDQVVSSISYALTANIENLTLSGSANLDGTGNDLANKIVGNTGANILTGGLGHDTINAAAGNDTLAGGEGNDKLFGEDGNDVISGGNGTDQLNGGYGTDTLNGGAGNDGLFGGGLNDNLNGGDGNDGIYGDGGNDIISGGAGNDLLAGGQYQHGYSVGFDTFTWVRSDIVNASGVRVGLDTLVDFGSGDRLDFSGVFTGSPVQPLHDLVKVTDTAAGTMVSLSIGDHGAFIDTVILKDVHHVSLDDLNAHHAITV